ncbi:MAG TPA: hypothetical protein VKB96_15020, partial [Gammaproteobacteria bacterium]|nr:hypothetical protein [Gammaproteobacteria bacterium]
MRWNIELASGKPVLVAECGVLEYVLNQSAYGLVVGEAEKPYTPDTLYRRYSQQTLQQQPADALMLACVSNNECDFPHVCIVGHTDEAGDTNTVAFLAL